VVRLASQACGIGFAILGFGNTNMFLAFLILGAEGYFTLVNIIIILISLPFQIN
jgi:hypothetical protein